MALGGGRGGEVSDVVKEFPPCDGVKKPHLYLISKGIELQHVHLFLRKFERQPYI